MKHPKQRTVSPSKKDVSPMGGSMSSAIHKKKKKDKDK
jgi:hypothetical protein